MEIETFRYLMSALLQVFGALVAVGAIFLVFQHDKLNILLRARSDEVAEALLEMERRGYFDYGLLEKHSIDNLDLIKCQLPQMSSEQVDGFIEDVRKVLNRIIEELQQQINSHVEGKKEIVQRMGDIQGREVYLHYLHENLRRSIDDKRMFISKAYRVMGLPAISAIVYGLLLLFADRIYSSSLVYWGSLSIFLAAITFAYTIYVSVSSFK